MRVDQTSSLSSTSPRREAKAASGDGRFAEALAGDVTTTAASAPKLVASVDNLFMLQEVAEYGGERRKRALQRGSSMLDRLDDFRIGLLTGSLPRGQLENLRHMAREQLDQVDDPELEAVLKDIDLRVAVELAKLENAT